LVLCAAFSAGFVDAIVGGGGLIQLPALLAGYPAIAPPLLLGTGKVGSICGTTSAVMRYMRVVRIPWRVLLPGAAVAFLAALAGASLVSAVSPALYRPLVPVMLTVVLAYVLWHKDLGARHAPIPFSPRRSCIALAAITGIGFYDGFFGPGTGSFLMLLFIRLYGFDFLHASAGARTINVATNAGALLFFGVHGEIHWGAHGDQTRQQIRPRGVHRHRHHVDREDRRRCVDSPTLKRPPSGDANRVPSDQVSCASRRPGVPIDARPNDVRDGEAPSVPRPIHAVRQPNSSIRRSIRIPARGPRR